MRVSLEGKLIERVVAKHVGNRGDRRRWLDEANSRRKDIGNTINAGVVTPFGKAGQG
jgi:hypothetical protein